MRVNVISFSQEMIKRQPTRTHKSMWLHVGKDGGLKTGLSMLSQLPLVIQVL